MHAYICSKFLCMRPENKAHWLGWPALLVLKVKSNENSLVGPANFSI